MVTTLLNPKEAPKSALKILYRGSWKVVLDLRNIKTTLGMEPLRCKRPEMAMKELWVYLLAYNLIRPQDLLNLVPFEPGPNGTNLRRQFHKYQSLSSTAVVESVLEQAPAS